MFKNKIKKAYVQAAAIVVAAGSGRRMESGENKQFIILADKPILAHTLLAVSSANTINKIIVCVREEDILRTWDMIEEFRIDKISKIITGGSTRQESVYNALREVDESCGYIAIHDGARPLIDPDLIDDAVYAAQEYRAVTLGTKVKDTIKRTGNGNFIEETLNRENLWQIQTPQVFEFDLIKTAHEISRNQNIETTDDCALLENSGIKIYILEGDYNNIKITTPEDLTIAEGIMLT